MTALRLLMLRHGPTSWNLERRIQGRSDIPLSPVGRETVSRWRLPQGFLDAPALVSPLRRAIETAELLDLRTRTIEPRLVEMAWGGYEGRTLASLRRAGGAAFAAEEARGLDFTPPGGESPRVVCARLADLLGELAGSASGARVLVTHKGVLRAAVALATGWPMLDRPPVRLDQGRGLLVQLTPKGQPTGAETIGLEDD